MVVFPAGVKFEPGSEIGESASSMLVGTMLEVSDEVSVVRISIEVGVEKGGFWVRDCVGTSASPVRFDIGITQLF